MNIEPRFHFGKNWQNYVDNITASQISQAEESLKFMLNYASLESMRFLDAGSGSGLFPLRRVGLAQLFILLIWIRTAWACTTRLREEYFPNDPGWIVEQGSVLDKNYLSKLGKFDIVYSWGVLAPYGEYVAKR